MRRPRHGLGSYALMMLFVKINLKYSLRRAAREAHESIPWQVKRMAFCLATANFTTECADQKGRTASKTWFHGCARGQRSFLSPCSTCKSITTILMDGSDYVGPRSRVLCPYPQAQMRARADIQSSASSARASANLGGSQADMEAELAALDAEEAALRDADDDAAVDALNAACPPP